MTMAFASGLVVADIQFSEISFSHHMQQSRDWHFYSAKSNKNGGISLSQFRTAHGKPSVKNSLKQPLHSENAKRPPRLKRSAESEKSRGAPRNDGNSIRRSMKAASVSSRKDAAKTEMGNKSAIKKPKKHLAKTVVEVLTERIHKKDWEGALKVFGMLREQQWYKPNVNTYRKILALLGKCGQHEQAYALFQMMLEEGCDINAEVYTALISAYGRSGLLDRAFAILDEMKVIPQCQPDVFTYSILIQSCVEASRFDQVDRLLAEMSGRGLMANTVTNNILIGGYGKAGMFEEMENVLSQMLESDVCKPDEWTMNVILRVVADRGQIEMMERWYEKFQSIGIHPNIRTFNTLISAYGKERLYDKMTAVMEYMQSSSFSWTTETYNVVIDAFGREGEIEQVENVFNQMRLEHVKPDSTTFCSLISAYGKAGIFNPIIKIVQHVENSDIIPDTPFFNSVIDACQRAGNLTEMENVFRQMKDRGCIPDEITFTTMSEAYLREGMEKKIQEMEQEMQRMALTAA